MLPGEDNYPGGWDYDDVIRGGGAASEGSGSLRCEIFSDLAARFLIIIFGYR